jgi:type I restriction enzyme R subunit
LVKRVLLAQEPADVPSIDQSDLIVIDECHRGYLLDQELSDAELSFRSQDDYISKYRRVLEHFDAVKIGLTATPALHTVEIFGNPIYTYSYREAVIDGYLIDYLRGRARRNQGARTILDISSEKPGHAHLSGQPRRM